jgi:RimJ/RimL family protein N-acetyltransferase
LEARVICRGCRFVTSRLEASEWHSTPNATEDLSIVIAQMLTPAVTQTLPDEWHGPYSQDEARDWIIERDSEGATLLIRETGSNQPVGLMILFEFAVDDTEQLDVRLGYLLSEGAWGRGFASEMVEGFVAWCRAQPQLRSIAWGVEHGNDASARVLINNGFVAAAAEDSGERIFQLSLR